MQGDKRENVNICLYLHIELPLWTVQELEALAPVKMKIYV